MATFDLEEQERIDALKDWWRQYGKYVYLVVAAFLLGVVGVQGWRYYQSTQAEKAAALFAEVEKVARLKDAGKLKDGTAKLAEQFPGSVYAARAALLSAAQSVDAGDLDAARAQLQWVIDKSGHRHFQNLARLRLARILLDQKQFDSALALLDGIKDEAFVPLTADLRGDILAAQGKTAEARAAYQLALDKSSQRDPLREFVQIKRDALGEAR